MKDVSKGFGKSNGVGSFDFCATLCKLLRMKMLYGVYIVIQSHALLICQAFVENSLAHLLLCTLPSTHYRLPIYTT